MKTNNKFIIIIISIIIILVVGGLILANSKNDAKEDNSKFKIVTSFYPIYIMTANITEGANNIELINMTDTNTGCIHNYTLVAEDMKKLEKADVFIQNGLELENFIDNITNANKDIKVINSSV